MKLMVTGGSGYFGSVLVPELIRQGHHVDVFDIKAPVAGNWINRDIYLNPLEANDLSNVDAVIHLAALVGDIICHKEPQRAVEVNYLATKYLARACKKKDVKFIFASSCSVYGVKNEVCTEETDPEPYSVYGITKLKAEDDVLAAGGIALRKATIYGASPRMRYDLVINEFVRGAKKDGEIRVFGGSQKRPFLEINSAVAAYVACLKSNQSGVFNISDEGVTLLELGKMVGEIFGCKVRVILEIVDKRSYVIDPSYAIRELGFKPKRLKEGLMQMKSNIERTFVL